MEELDKRIHALKWAIRTAVNASELPNYLAVEIIESVKSEIMKIELTELKQKMLENEVQSTQEGEPNEPEISGDRNTDE